MELNIVYERPGHYFIPGEILRGHVDATNSSKSEIEVLRFVSRCVGRVITCWTDNHPPQETVYTETHKFFGRTASPDPAIGILTPGVTHVGFAFELPTNFKPGPLANFKSRFGNVEFYVEVEVEYVNKRTRLTLIRATEKAVRRFRIQPDSTVPPELTSKPVSVEMEWPVGLFFFGRRGAVRMEFSMGSANFLPGQLLDYKMMVKNATRRKIVSVTLKLKQIVTYKAQAFSKVRKEVRLEQKLIDYPACIPPTGTENFTGSSGTATGTELRIPNDLPPSSFGGCPLIDVAYVLQVIILVFGFHKSKANIPVTICSVPIEQNSAPDTVRDRSGSLLGIPLGVGGAGGVAPPSPSRFVLDKMESIDIGGKDTKYQPIDSD